MRRAPESVLTLTRSRQAEFFGPLDVRIVPGFADQAAPALRLSQSRRDRERLRHPEDREQLLGELDNAILFAMMRISLALTSAASRPNPEVRGLVLEQVSELDSLSRRVRNTVFDLPGA